MQRVLLVEDDLFLREGLTELITGAGYRVAAASTCREAEAALKTGPALAVLDIGLPDGDGLTLCRRWRAAGHGLPILFLTALDEEVQVVRGLDAGGNDYVVKPFRTMELLGRIRALLRTAAPGRVDAGGLAVDLNLMTVHRDGQLLFVTPTEFKILAALMRNGHQILTRRQLLQMIWDQGEQFIDDNTLSVHVSRLRDKIGVDRIRTVRGVGYTWEPPC